VPNFRVVANRFKQVKTTKLLASKRLGRAIWSSHRIPAVSLDSCGHE
jgi:hypothetical protein